MKPFRLTRRTLHHGLCLLTPVWLPETQQGTLPFTLTGDRSEYFRLHMATASSVHCLTWKIPNSAGTHNCPIYKYLKPKTIKTLNPKRKTSNPKPPPPPPPPKKKKAWKLGDAICFKSLGSRKSRGRLGLPCWRLFGENPDARTIIDKMENVYRCKWLIVTPCINYE